MSDVGLTHVALPVKDLERSIAFYSGYAGMRVVHRRPEVVWLSDGTRAFVVVLIERPEVGSRLGPLAHLGVGCAGREEVDRLVEKARAEGIAVDGPHDSGPPVGYWALLHDPDGHTVELSHGQEVGLVVSETLRG